MLNNVTIMGRLTRNPELRRTNNATAVANFTLAVERDVGDKDNRETDFIDCCAWGKTAEFVSKYFSKGRMAIVSGRLQIRAWKDKEGANRRSAEVVASCVYFGDSRKPEADTTNGSQDLPLLPDDGPLPF